MSQKEKLMKHHKNVNMNVIPYPIGIKYPKAD